MAVYDYLCECGVVTEALAGSGVKTLACGACGQPALRQSVYLVSVTGLPTRGAARRQFADFQEASQEVDHAYQQSEEQVGHPVERPNYWEIAKARAKRLQKAGSCLRR